MTTCHLGLLVSTLLACAVSGVAATEIQSDQAVVQLSSIDSMCILPISSSTLVTSPDDMAVLQASLLKMAQRLGYRVAEECVEADPVMETSFSLVTKKDYGSWQPGGPTKVEYVVFRLIIRQYQSGELWEGRFEERYIPGKVQKIGGSLINRTERKIAKDIRRQKAKSGKTK